MFFSLLALPLVLSLQTAEVTAQNCEFSETYQQKMVPCDFVISNHSAREQSIQLRAIYLGDTISPNDVILKPHSTATVHVFLDLRLASGLTQHSFEWTGGTTQAQSKQTLVARGFVQSVLDDSRPKLNFGSVDVKALEDAKQVFDVKSSEHNELRIMGVSAAPPDYHIKISDDGKQVSVGLDKTATWGYHTDVLYFKTNLLQQPEIALSVEADIHGDVVPESNPLALGLLRQGNRNEILIRLSSRTGKSFRLGDIKLEGIEGDATSQPCMPDAQGCRLLQVRLSDKQPLGQIIGRVIVQLPDYAKELYVNVWGLYVLNGTEVKNLNEETEKTSADNKGNFGPKMQTAQSIDQHLDLKKLLQTKLNPRETPAGNGPLLQWTVAHEELVYGYVIYRANGEEGPFLRLNQEILRVTDPVESGRSSYQYRDTSADPGKTYWYYIGMVYNDGHKQQLTGPQKVTAK